MRQGSRWMPAQCIHGDARDNTDDPIVMTRDGPWCDHPCSVDLQLEWHQLLFLDMVCNWVIMNVVGKLEGASTGLVTSFPWFTLHDRENIFSTKFKKDLSRDCLFEITSFFDLDLIFHFLFSFFSFLFWFIVFNWTYEQSRLWYQLFCLISVQLESIVHGVPLTLDAASLMQLDRRIPWSVWYWKYIWRSSCWYLFFVSFKN